MGAKEAGFSTLVVEARGFDLNFETQVVYCGTVVSDVLPPAYLRTSRLLQFGGTTNHWGGHSVVINANIFGPRAGVPGGKWPFGSDELRSYYVRAAEILRKDRGGGGESGSSGGFRLRPAWCPWSAIRERRRRKADWVPRTVRNWRRRDCRFSSTAARPGSTSRQRHGADAGQESVYRRRSRLCPGHRRRRERPALAPPDPLARARHRQRFRSCPTILRRSPVQAGSDP